MWKFLENYFATYILQVQSQIPGSPISCVWTTENEHTHRGKSLPYSLIIFYVSPLLKAMTDKTTDLWYNVSPVVRAMGQKHKSKLSQESVVEYRGRILGRNPDKSLKSFPLCYSKSFLLLCLEISISSNSRNLLGYIVKEKRGKPDRQPYPLPCG